MTEEEFKKRPKKFALDVIGTYTKLPKNKVCEHLGYQWLRAGTSVGANYRAACKGKSKADFVAKLGIVEEEADECQYWIELLVDSKLVKPEDFRVLWKEASEITAMINTSINTSRRNGK